MKSGNVLAPAVAIPVSAASGVDDTTSAVRRAGFVDIGILCAFLPLIAVGWVQFQGLWLLEVERLGDRTVAGFTVPTPWLLAVNAIAIVILFLCNQYPAEAQDHTSARHSGSLKSDV